MTTVVELLPNIVVVRDDVAHGVDGAPGAPGAPGSQILTGSGAPSNLLGVNSDIYVDVVSGDFYKKILGIWVLQGNIKGPPGQIQIEYFTLNSSQISAKAVTLNLAPTDPTMVAVNIRGGVAQFLGDDFTVVGDQLQWNGLGMEPILATGDKIVVMY